MLCTYYALNKYRWHEQRKLPTSPQSRLLVPLPGLRLTKPLSSLVRGQGGGAVLGEDRLFLDAKVWVFGVIKKNANSIPVEAIWAQF